MIRKRGFLEYLFLFILVFSAFIGIYITYIQKNIESAESLKVSLAKRKMEKLKYNLRGFLLENQTVLSTGCLLNLPSNLFNITSNGIYTYITDPWGNPYKVCYVKNSEGCIENITYISAGPNTIFETSCNDTTCRGDDICLNVNTGKLISSLSLKPTLPNNNIVSFTGYKEYGYTNVIENKTYPFDVYEICFKNNQTYVDYDPANTDISGGNCTPGDVGFVIMKDYESPKNYYEAYEYCFMRGMRLPEVFEGYVISKLINEGKININYPYSGTPIDDEEWFGNDFQLSALLSRFRGSVSTSSVQTEQFALPIYDIDYYVENYASSSSSTYTTYWLDPVNWDNYFRCAK